MFWLHLFCYWFLFSVVCSRKGSSTKTENLSQLLLNRLTAILAILYKLLQCLLLYTVTVCIYRLLWDLIPLRRCLLLPMSVHAVLKDTVTWLNHNMVCNTGNIVLPVTVTVIHMVTVLFLSVNVAILYKKHYISFKTLCTVCLILPCIICSFR